MKRVTKIIGCIIAIALIATACKKENKTGTLTVRMVDQPIPYEQVNVEVEFVQVHFNNTDNGAEGWVDLETNKGIYNLLDLQNGVSAVLVDGEVLPVGYLSQLRLVLGDDNTVVIAGITYPLALSSQDKNGLKINLDTTIHDGDDVEIIFDFDTEKSIVVEGNGTYRLKPVLHLESVEFL